MTKPTRIFIVGHMGSGKFLLTETLAKRLGWQVIDANPSLERYIGKSLSQILGKEGEEAFHRCEAEIIAQCNTKENAVIVLEEGVIVSEENRKLLSKEFVVYLKVSTHVQIERMSLGQGRVPLLPIADLKEFLDKQHEDRDSLYEEVATLTVETSTIDEDVEKVLNAIQ